MLAERAQGSARGRVDSAAVLTGIVLFQMFREMSNAVPTGGSQIHCSQEKQKTPLSSVSSSDVPV